ncbi:MAG: hypothetical protein ACYDDF_04135 [Thermoplasmatota archaeon]
MEKFFAGVGGSGWANTMLQYASSTQGHITNPNDQMNATTDVWNDLLDPAPTQTTWSSQIETVVGHAVAHFGYDRDADYFVAVGQGGEGTDPSNGGWCAWHSSTWTTSGEVAFTNLPYQPDYPTGCNGLTDATVVAGHEYAETITDPFPNTGYMDQNGQEIGDKCVWQVQTTSFSTGTFNVQSLWSNSTSGCVFSSPNSCGCTEPADFVQANVGGTLRITPPNGVPLEASSCSTPPRIVAPPNEGAGGTWNLSLDPAQCGVPPNTIYTFSGRLEGVDWHTPALWCNRPPSFNGTLAVTSAEPWATTQSCAPFNTTTEGGDYVEPNSYGAFRVTAPWGQTYNATSCSGAYPEIAIPAGQPGGGWWKTTVNVLACGSVPNGNGDYGLNAVIAGIPRQSRTFCNAPTRIDVDLNVTGEGNFTQSTACTNPGIVAAGDYVELCGYDAATGGGATCDLPGVISLQDPAGRGYGEDCGTQVLHPAPGTDALGTWRDQFYLDGCDWGWTPDASYVYAFQAQLMGRTFDSPFIPCNSVDKSIPQFLGAIEVQNETNGAGDPGVTMTIACVTT